MTEPSTSTSTPILNTPLSAWHKEHGAKMAPFAGWDMPIQYSGILDEHKHTREKATVFDICHMGEFSISGPGAAEGLSKVLTHNLATLKPGRCRYGFMLNEQGGILDDLIVYRKAENDFFLVVNAARTQDDFNWLRTHLANFQELQGLQGAKDSGSQLRNLSDETGKIDLQGPLALEVLEAGLGQSFRSLPYFAFVESRFAGSPLLVSRTGYTGELGYELYLPASKTVALWELLLKHPEVKPAGLGARDTLRLEAGLPLYGQDLDAAHTPAEAGYTAMLNSEANYIGKKHAFTIREQLVALSIEGRRSARHDDPVFLSQADAGKKQQVGRITSASFSPTLGHAVALAYIKSEYAAQTHFSIEAQKTKLEGKIVPLPFYQGSARIKL